MWKHGDSLMQMQHDSDKIITVIPQSSPFLRALKYNILQITSISLYHKED